MFRYLFLLISIFIITACSDEVDTPVKLFEEIKIAAINNDKIRLKDLVYKTDLPDRDTRKEILKGIIKNYKAGDCAYSDEAISSLIDHHMDKFRIIDNNLRNKLFTEGELKNDTTLANLPLKNILVFDENNVRIIIVKVKNMYQLLFWENLNNIIPSGN